MVGQYAAFEPILRQGRYLSLLNHVEVDVLLEVNTAVRRTPKLPEAVSNMLGERNWRTDVVAALAAVLADSPAACVQSLWEAFDYGSWVAPQLAVSLCLIDPEFRQSARVRIATRCAPADGAQVRPAPRDIIVAKNLGSLLQVLGQIDGERAWVDSARNTSEMRHVLELDVDSAGDIARAWGDSLSAALRALRRVLAQGSG